MKKITSIAFTILLQVLLVSTTVGQGDNPNPTIVRIGGSNTVNCASPAQQIGVTISNWTPGFIYSWNTGETDSVITVNPEQTTTYILQISHTMLGISELRGFEIRVENDPIVTVDAEYIQDKYTCKGSELLIEPSYHGGHAPFSFLWENGSTDKDAILHPESTRQHSVKIIDACGTEAEAMINVIVEDHDPITPIPLKSINFDCVGDEITIKPNLSQVSGGIGTGYTYSFDNGLTFDSPIAVEANEETTLIAKVMDGCLDQSIDAKFELVKNPIEIPETPSITACYNEVVNITQSNSETLYFWDGKSMNPDYQQTVTSDDNITLTYLDRCGDPHKVDRQISMSEVQVEFDYDAHESNGSVELFANTSGDIATYEWSVNGKQVGSTEVLVTDMAPGSVNEVELTVINTDGCFAKTHRTVAVEDNYSIPSAFSPNNDGKNDFFKLDIDEQFTDFKIEIYDRWGQLIYHSSDQYFTWKGEENTTGILNMYLYKLNGTTIGGTKVEKTGTLSVVN